jgi:hypothetical protein
MTGTQPDAFAPAGACSPSRSKSLTPAPTHNVPGDSAK